MLFSTSSSTPGPGIYSTPSSFVTGGNVTPYLSTAGTGTGTPSPYAFYQNAGANIMYVADDRNPGGGGGIQKWINVASVWTLTYTIPTGTVGARGVVANFSGSIPIIYATTAEGVSNRLLAIGDVGPGSTSTLIATSGTNTIFRGVAFSPSNCAIPNVNIATSNPILCSNYFQSATLTASGATTYSWSTGSSGSTIIVTPSITTTYSATGTNTCGSSASFSFTQTSVICGGLKSINSIDLVKLYPNPAKDVLNISFDEQASHTISIVDALGKVIYTNESDKNVSINTSALLQGMYFVKIKTAQKQSILKFIKD